METGSNQIIIVEYFYIAREKPGRSPKHHLFDSNCKSDFLKHNPDIIVKLKVGYYGKKLGEMEFWIDGVAHPPSTLVGKLICKMELCIDNIIPIQLLHNSSPPLLRESVFPTKILTKQTKILSRILFGYSNSFRVRAIFTL